MKTCSKCGINKSKEEFHTDNRAKDGSYSCCKVCVSKRMKEYYQIPKGKETRREYQQAPKGKEIKRNSYLKIRYGITLEQYDDILETQGSRCKICGTDIPGGMGRFHVDHNHITGEIRGLLCHGCNTALGGFKDNINILANAIKYLSDGCTGRASS